MLLLMAPLFLPAPAWARGNGGHSGRGHGSHHRAHHRGGSAWRGAPCMAVHSGDLHVNWGPQWRADLMPYGGVKDSGFGKEGPAYAVLEGLGQMRDA